MRWPRRPVGTPVTPVPEPPPGDEALVRSLQALLERLATIWRRITNRADLQETLDVLTAGAAELLGEPIAAVRLVDEDDPGFARRSRPSAWRNGPSSAYAAARSCAGRRAGRSSSTS
jgi:hypothetical protein